MNDYNNKIKLEFKNVTISNSIGKYFLIIILEFIILKLKKL